MNLKIRDFISYDYEGEKYIGIVRKIGNLRAAIELKKYGTCIHRCSDFFSSNKGMWFYKNDSRFENVKILTKQQYFIGCLK